MAEAQRRGSRRESIVLPVSGLVDIAGRADSARRSSTARRATVQLRVESMSEDNKLQTISEDTTGGSSNDPHPVWPHAAKKTSRKSRRQSVLAEELETMQKKWAQDPPQIIEENKQPVPAKKAEQRKDSLEQGGTVPLQSQASQKLADSHKLEDQINLQHLVELMQIFHEADENGSDGLDIDEFRAAFGQILGKGKNDQQMAIMFMKIDTNCDGTVDWDEFCTYMLLEYQEKEVMAGEKLPPFPFPLRPLYSSHREMVTAITFLPSMHHHRLTGSSASGEGGEGVEGRYLSVCRDGTLYFWKSNFTIQKTVNVDCGRSKLTWVTHMIALPNVNKMMLAFTDNMLALYDLSTANCERLMQIVGLPHCVLNMEYWFDPRDYNKAVLVTGDSGGNVCIMEFSNATHCLFSPSHSTGAGAVGGGLHSHRVHFQELLHTKQEALRTTFLLRVHRDWVCQVKYCPSMEYIMSCSNDCDSSLHLVDLHGRKEGSMLHVRKGISAFDYSKDWNMIATGGLDRFLRYWNPYVTGKPTAVLKGHSTAIVFISISSSHGHVLSFSKDMELRVWDIQDQLCLQCCHRCLSLLPQEASALFLHPHTGSLLIGTNQLYALEHCSDDEQHRGRGEVVSHEKALCAALYNTNFNQVVSGCHGSVVSVWDADTGEKTIQFSQCHGSMEITAMAFDNTGRRLITGGKDGSIKLWNFNNGACLSVLDSSYNAEVTCICFMKQRIIVGGWSRRLAVYSDARDPDDTIPKYWGEGIHRDDILCLAYSEPNLLASADYEGEIVLWNLDVERNLCRFNANDEASRGQHWQNYCSNCSEECLSGEEEGDGSGGAGGLLESLSGRPQSKSVRFSGSSCRGESSCGSSRRPRGKKAVEKIVFLQNRENDISSASMVAVGDGGWVHMWNVSGGGLVGEFNIWSSPRHQLDRGRRELECVTSLSVNPSNTTMYTGNSLGYMQVWDISDYCVKVSPDLRPVTSPPPVVVAWRGHLSSIVSIDLSEERGLVVTASTDCCVRMWTTKGRYIGTFGEKCHWQLTHPLQPSCLPRKMPAGINRAASFSTIQTVSGPSTSKWKLARNLFRVLRHQNLFKTKGGATTSEAGQSSSSQGSASLSRDEVLGKHYTRKTRVRQPINPINLRHDDGRVMGIYSTLKCPDIAEPDHYYQMTQPGDSTGSAGGYRRARPSEPSSDTRVPSVSSQSGLAVRDTQTPRLQHTEASLLPFTQQHPHRKVTITG